MRVKCFYGGSYPNGFSPMSMRLHHYMKALAAEGAEVEVVVPSAQPQAPGTCEGIPYRYERPRLRPASTREPSPAPMPLSVADWPANVMRS